MSTGMHEERSSRMVYPRRQVSVRNGGEATKIDVAECPIVHAGIRSRGSYRGS